MLLSMPVIQYFLLCLLSCSFWDTAAIQCKVYPEETGLQPTACNGRMEEFSILQIHNDNKSLSFNNREEKMLAQTAKDLVKEGGIYKCNVSYWSRC